jgi:Transcriptional regulator containing an amidase domain and an AraC-type DNA-binding HTH domain
VDDRLRDDYFARVCSAVEYADGHLGEDLSLARLAEVACFSPRHFHRVFTSLLDETPDDCVRRLRLQRAAGLILSREAPTMTEIAMACGFSTPALFSRNFSRHYGSSPTEWREGMKRQEKVKQRQVPVASGKDPRTSFRYLVGEDEDEVEVEIVAMKSFTACCVPYLQGYNEGVGEAFARLARWARPRGLLAEGSRFITIPFDNPSTTPPQRCRNYAAVIAGGMEAEKAAVEKAAASRGVVRSIALGGCTYFKATNKGPDRKLHSIYRLLYETAIPDSGYASFGGTGFIEYLGKSWALASAQGPEAGSRHTIIHVPVRPGVSP